MSKHASKGIWLWVESFAPVIFGAASMGGLIFWAEPIACKFASDEWSSAGLYSAIFGWSAIQTGFAFGVFGFVISKTDGFVAALKGTKTLSRFESYIRRANWTGFLLTIITIPMIVAEPKPDIAGSVSYYVVTAWFSFFVWAFLAFLRLAYNFGGIAGIKDKEFLGA